MPSKPKRWTMHDVPTREEMAAYLAHIQAVRDALPDIPAFPPLPESMDRLTVEGANEIERFLEEACGMITNIEKGWFYSGEIAAGEV